MSDLCRLFWRQDDCVSARPAPRRLGRHLELVDVVTAPGRRVSPGTTESSRSVRVGRSMLPWPQGCMRDTRVMPQVCTLRKLVCVGCDV